MASLLSFAAWQMSQQKEKEEDEEKEEYEEEKRQLRATARAVGKIFEHV